MLDVQKIKNGILNKNFYKKRDKIKEELDKLNKIESLLEHDLNKLFLLLEKIRLKHKVDYKCNFSDKKEFDIRVYSERNDSLYEDLNTIIIEAIKQSESLHYIVPYGHGFTGLPVEYYDYNSELPFYDIMVGTY